MHLHHPSAHLVSVLAAFAALAGAGCVNGELPESMRSDPSIVSAADDAGLNGSADAARANALLPADARVTFNVRDVVDDDGVVIASAPVPEDWLINDVSGFTFAAPPPDPATGSVTGLVIDNNCYGQCSPKDWGAVLRAPGELIDRRLAAGANERPVEGSDGVVLQWTDGELSKVQVLRWADDTAFVFSCLAVVAEDDLALRDSLEMACLTTVPALIPIA